MSVVDFPADERVLFRLDEVDERPFWRCHCGNHQFIVTLDSYVCGQCGKEEMFGDEYD